MAKVSILGSHPNHGFSMARFTDLLEAGYRRAGHDVRVLRPPTFISRGLRAGTIKKYASYLEQLVLFPLAITLSARSLGWVHIADHSDALWLILPMRAVRRVVTCHDLIAVRAARGELKEHMPSISGRVYQSMVLAGLKRASLIEVVSHETGKDVERLVGGRISVVYNPVSPAILEVTTLQESPYDRPYVLVVSTSGWRKRREHAISVWLHLVATLAPDSIDLVVVGPPLSSQEACEIPADIRARVHEETGVDDVRLAELYKGARALIQMSKYEGFGWPIVEANSHGTVAICADEPVFREIGPGSIFVAEALAQTDWSEVASQMENTGLIELARKNAQRFTMETFSLRLEEARLSHLASCPPAAPSRMGGTAEW